MFAISLLTMIAIAAVTNKAKPSILPLLQVSRVCHSETQSWLINVDKYNNLKQTAKSVQIMPQLVQQTLKTLSVVTMESARQHCSSCSESNNNERCFSLTVPVEIWRHSRITQNDQTKKRSLSEETPTAAKPSFWPTGITLSCSVTSYGHRWSKPLYSLEYSLV